MKAQHISYLAPFAVAFLIGASGTAFAQGTSAQREACAPDAIRLCDDTIPDVSKTAACMRAHFTELSPACRAQFADAGSQSGASTHARRRTARAAPSDNDEVDAGLPDMGGLDVDADDAPASRAADRREARRVVGGLCRNEVLDADLCRVAKGAIDMSR